MSAAILPLQDFKRARTVRCASLRSSASFQPLPEAEKKTLYARLRNRVASMASTAAGRARAAYWASRLPIAEQAIAQESSSPQAEATSSAKSRLSWRLNQIGLQERQVASDGKCLVSHLQWLLCLLRHAALPQLTLPLATDATAPHVRCSTGIGLWDTNL